VSGETHVLVTGGAGFIGSHTVDHLMARGCRVLVIDDLSTGSRANIRSWLSHPRFAFIEGDVTGDLERMLDPIARSDGPVERIIHFAAQTAVPLSVDNPVEDIRINLGGTARVLEYARRHGVAKVVFASSSAVYDDEAPVPVSEQSRARPSSPYGIDKLAAEFFLDYYARIHGLRFTALRFMNVYGPRQDPKSYYSGVISIFLDRALRGAPITIFGDGEQTRDFVFVTDVANAVATACLDDRGDGEIINIGTGVEVAINRLARTVLSLAGSRSEIVYDAPRLGDIRRSVTTTDKARAQLGFAPKVGLSDGLAQTLAWVRAGVEPAAAGA
jgi:UDP-glucose 4-epimerase